MKQYLQLPLSTLLLIVTLVAVILAWRIDFGTTNRPLYVHILQSTNFIVESDSKATTTVDVPRLVLTLQLPSDGRFDVTFSRHEQQMTGTVFRKSTDDYWIDLEGNFATFSFSNKRAVKLDTAYPINVSDSSHWFILSTSASHDKFVADVQVQVDAITAASLKWKPSPAAK